MSSFCFCQLIVLWFAGREVAISYSEEDSQEATELEVNNSKALYF